MAGFIYTPMGKDGRGLPFYRPDAAQSPFPATLTSAAAQTTAAIDAHMVLVHAIGFRAHMKISPEGTAATSNDFPIPADTTVAFAIRPGDRVSLIGSDVTGASAFVFVTSEV